MSSTAHEAREEGVVEQAKSGLGDAASTAQEKAVELKEQGKGRLAETLDTRTTQMGGQARTAADAMRQTSSQMRTQGDSSSTQVAHAMDAVANQVEQLGGYLERTSGDRLLHDVEDFARRRPWMVAGIGLLAGIAASRFLKASSERRYESRYPSGYPYRSPMALPTERRGGDGYVTEVT